LDLVEKQQPDIFNNENHKFLDPYAKTGIFLREIASRLFKSERLIKRFPDLQERAN
jgi:type II restriction enzyme